MIPLGPFFRDLVPGFNHSPAMALTRLMKKIRS